MSRSCGVPCPAPPTVYRALDFLLEQGLIHKVERLNAYLGCVETGQGGHAHGTGDGGHHDHPHQFLICRNCGATAELCDPAVADAVRAIAVSEATYHRWRAEYGGLKLDGVKRLKELERENARLRRAVSDLTLEKVVLKEAASGNVWSAPPQQGSSW